ncbi:hypothetical protein [Xylanibacter ruminicola]|uniref:Uncharacterized protein n=1 Tax=Xylanibacter ruminicola TaxID=839 RepID=A0A1M6VEQ4_XYLRU|nr:hypothetical protein [Xylanibacter ruminicola]SHK80027.1 hypothetical protein SAMN05216463_11287 [Xylanibacter ruminicola]
MANNNEYAPQNFNQQFEEEKRKYELCKDSAWSEAISQWEDEPCLEGRIKFLLDYSNGNVEDFKKYAERAVELLKDENNRFERLLLNQNGSSYPCQLENMKVSKEKKDSFKIEHIEQFSFSNKGKGDRDFGWHRLLNDNPEEYTTPRKDSLVKCQEAAKNIICNNLPEETEIEPNSDLEEWKQLLVKCPKLIRYCTGTIIYKVTYGDGDGTSSYYLSTDTRDHLLGKRNKISELYTRYLYETIHEDNDDWEYVTWSFKEESQEIDSYLKKGEIEIRRQKNKWSFKGQLSFNECMSVDDLAYELKKSIII